MTTSLDDLDFGSVPTAGERQANLKASRTPIHGLVDGVRAAAMLQLENEKRFSVWLSKKAKALSDSKPLAPLLDLLPEPAGYFNGAPVFREEEVIRFGIEAGFLEDAEWPLSGTWTSAGRVPIAEMDPADLEEF